MADDPTPQPAPDPPAPATDPAPTDPPKPPDYPDGLGDAGKKALDEERKARRDAEAKLKDLEPLAAKARELEDAQKTEVQKLTEQLEAAKAEGTTAKTETARLQAAIKHGLSQDDLDLLGAGTPEEIEERAKRLRERLDGAEGKQPVVPSSRNQGGGGSESAVEDPDKIAERILSRNRI